MILKRCLIVLMIVCCPSVISAGLPESNEATIIEYTSPTEVLIEAVGIYNSQEKSRRRRRREIKKEGVDRAIEDAKKAAVYYLIFNGTDPLLSTPDDLKRFAVIQDAFFSEDLVRDAITYVAPSPTRKVVTNRRESIKVYIKLRVNKAYLRQVLEENDIIFSQRDLAAELGYPQIMVLPFTPNNEDPLYFLSKNPDMQHASGVIESHLTAKKYDVILPSQLENINRLVAGAAVIKQQNQDPMYQLALSIGSDVYIQYSISESESAYDTTQLSATVKAYETTTGRLLGTETGYSQARLGSKQLSIEEALLSALNNVTERILNYWEEDLERGKQYKVITTIQPSNLNDDQREDLQNALYEAFDELSQYVKDNITTEQTIDVTLWCDYETVATSRVLYKKLKKEFSYLQDSNLSLRKVNRNRKLLVLEIR